MYTRRGGFQAAPASNRRRPTLTGGLGSFAEAGRRFPPLPRASNVPVRLGKRGKSKIRENSPRRPAPDMVCLELCGRSIGAPRRGCSGRRPRWMQDGRIWRPRRPRSALTFPSARGLGRFLTRGERKKRWQFVVRIPGQKREGERYGKPSGF